MWCTLIWPSGVQSPAAPNGYLTAAAPTPCALHLLRPCSFEPATDRAHDTTWFVRSAGLLKVSCRVADGVLRQTGLQLSYPLQLLMWLIRSL